MAIYAVWNNKGGVGKSYLTFQVASEYARKHSDKNILVIDLCPQANASGMLLGGLYLGEENLDKLSAASPRKTIAGYIEDRIISPYLNPKTGSNYLTKIKDFNREVPSNLFLISGDAQLEIQGSRVIGATNPGPNDAWRLVHGWIGDLIEDIRVSWNQQEITVFIDCNPSFSIYTELALSASERLIIPFSADGSSKRAVKAVLELVYGISRNGLVAQKSEFVINSARHKMPVPRIYCYVGNRLTQYLKSASAFHAVVKEIGEEIWEIWKGEGRNCFWIHDGSAGVPTNRRAFVDMFQHEIVDANTASVVSSTMGIPIMTLTAGLKHIAPGIKPTMVNQEQLDKQQPNIRSLVNKIA
jgi:chromosome partitioning protein